MSATAVDLEQLRRWVGREQRREQVIDAFPARALAALLERAAPAEGDALPLPWQWLYFLDTPARSQLGADGHPARGDFLPPVPLPRRMWAAGRISVHQPLRVGLRATRLSSVRSVELKAGKAGPLVFVTVDHMYEQQGITCLHESQDLVYREAPTAPAPLPPGEPAPEAAAGANAWQQPFVADAPLLFRYSALSYNGHRIHTDRDYARHEEFYPGLVVHGPLLATRLLDGLQRARPDAAVREFAFRALRPAFEGQPLAVCGQVEAGGAELWTRDADGCIGMKATASFA